MGLDLSLPRKNYPPAAFNCFRKHRHASHDGLGRSSLWHIEPELQQLRAYLSFKGDVLMPGTIETHKPETQRGMQSKKE
jgi:hypothetical protein